MKKGIRSLKVLAIIAVMTMNLSVYGQWVQRGDAIYGEAAGDRCGNNVSLSADGHTIAVSALLNDGAGEDAGHVRLFSWDGSAWVQKGLDIDGENAGDESGIRLALSGDGETVAIGTDRNSDAGPYSGHVRVYNWNGTNWIQKGVDINGGDSYESSGRVAISADGNILAIGGPGYSEMIEGQGRVKVFEWDGSSWEQKGSDLIGDAVDDGTAAVSLSGDGSVLAVGASGGDVTAVNNGRVRIYDWGGVDWIQRGEDIGGEGADDYSGGYALELNENGNIVAIGAEYNSGLYDWAGHARVFEWDGESWTQKGNDIDGESEWDFAGTSIAITADGNTLAVGSTNTGGFSGDGKVSVYNWDGEEWILKGMGIIGETLGDRSVNTSISADGNTVAVGGSYNDNYANNAGHVRIFDFGYASVPSEQPLAELTIFPNPATEQITVQLPEGFQKGILKLIDFAGKEISQSNANQANVKLGLNGLDTGIYFVQFTDANGNTYRQKFVKSK